MLVLLVTITIGLRPLINFKVSAENPAEPIFEGFTAEGYEDTNAINFNEETEITVKYSVGRYVEVEGINIYGSGSGLNITPTEGLALNFSYSLKERTYYEGSFTLTNLTRFRGYAWIGDITNGTIEDLEVFNHLEAWHYLYVNEDGLPPDFSDILNASTTFTPGVYRATANKTDKPILAVYRVYGGTPSDLITLVTSVYRDKIINASLNIFNGDLTVVKMNFSEETETYVEFNATVEFSHRTLYFCANNSFGWDSWESSLNELHKSLSIKALYNGYDFYSQPTLEDKLTDVDNIRLNITTWNTTEIETFGINYYVEESAENDTIIVPWTEVQAALNQTYNETNEFDNIDIVREYIISIGSFSAGNILFYEAYNIYYDAYYNETNGNMRRLTVYDSKPNLFLYPINNTYTNQNNITFWYTSSLARGDIVDVSLDFGDGSPFENLTGVITNSTYHIYPQVTGDFNATLNITLNIARETDVDILVFNSIYTIIYLDFEAPLLDILDRTNNETDIVDGYVELYFEYSDAYSGILKVWVFWGDGSVQNVTDDGFAYHHYTNSSLYTITIMAEDLAGNQHNITVIYNVVLVTPTSVVPTPLAIIPAIISLILVGYVVKRKKDQRNV